MRRLQATRSSTRFALPRINGMLGSIDANQGDMLLGWDTDEFPTDLYSTTLTMYEVIKAGGIGKGGVNFDAKVRRGSFEDEICSSLISQVWTLTLGA